MNKQDFLNTLRDPQEARIIQAKNDYAEQLQLITHDRYFEIVRSHPSEIRTWRIVYDVDFTDFRGPRNTGLPNRIIADIKNTFKRYDHDGTMKVSVNEFDLFHNNILVYVSVAK